MSIPDRDCLATWATKAFGYRLSSDVCVFSCLRVWFRLVSFGFVDFVDFVSLFHAVRSLVEHI
jgi:uncharacterized membrane protein